MNVVCGLALPIVYSSFYSVFRWKQNDFQVVFVVAASVDDISTIFPPPREKMASL